MIAIVEVGLALNRPPREDITVFVTVSVPVAGFDFFGAELDAEQTAVAIAQSTFVPFPQSGKFASVDPVMPVRSAIIEITEL